MTFVAIIFGDFELAFSTCISRTHLQREVCVPLFVNIGKPQKLRCASLLPPQKASCCLHCIFCASPECSLFSNKQIPDTYVFFPVYIWVGNSNGAFLALLQYTNVVGVLIPFTSHMQTKKAIMCSCSSSQYKLFIWMEKLYLNVSALWLRATLFTSTHFIVTVGKIPKL